MVKILGILILTLSLSACSVLETASEVAGSVFTPTPSQTCQLPAAPRLPMPDEAGNVLLEPDDQAALLIYIEGLEHCLEQ